MPLELPRRSFLRGLFAAPAIVAYHNIMPVKLFRPDYVDVVLDMGLFDGRWVPRYELEMVRMRDLLLPGLKDLVAEYRCWPDLLQELQP